MNVIIDQVVQKCSSNQKGRRLVRGILDNMKNYENSDRVKSLELLSLRKILKWGMMAEDRGKVQVTLSLLFRETLNLRNFLGYMHVPRIYPKSRTDPVLIMAVLQQNLDRENHYAVRMCRDFLEICLENNPIARFPNRKNVKFDPLMVSMFAKLGFSKKTNYVLIQFRAQRKHNFKYIRNYLNQIMDTFEYATPPEDWNNAIKQTNHTIYCRTDPFSTVNRRIFQAGYCLVSRYCPLLPHKYYDFSLYK